MVTTKNIICRNYTTQPNIIIEAMSERMADPGAMILKILEDTLSLILSMYLIHRDRINTQEQRTIAYI